MDGLLIDSEPLWGKAAENLFLKFGKKLTAAQYASTTGLRTKEFLQHWFNYLNIASEHIPEAEKIIIDDVVLLVKQQGKPMPGVEYIINFFLQQKFKIGLATSSPQPLIEEVVDLLGIGSHLQVISSAADLAYGKPHPEVYLICAEKLGAAPAECICFEDSVNGMIAAKAARMKCVVVPSIHDTKNTAWQIADLKISTLSNFNGLLLDNI